MVCPNCDGLVEASDNFCRRCGAPLTGARLPLPATNARLPVPLSNVAGVMVRGAVALALTTAVEMSVRMLAKKLWQGPLSLVRSGAGGQAVSRNREEDHSPYEIYGESRAFVMRWVALRQPRADGRAGRSKK